MPTHSERQALLFLGVVAFLGGSVRIVRAHQPPAPPFSLPPVTARRDTNPPAGAPRRPPPKPGKTGKSRLPVAPAPPRPDRNHPVDVDHASAAELQALPGIGPALAARIVAYRDSAGPFGSLDHFQRVRGIGPATVKRLDTLITFSGIRPR